jgi:hypothetical protein
MGFSRGDLMVFGQHDHSFTGFDRAVVVDVMTTGFDPKLDRVLRITCLRGSIADFANKGFTRLDQFTARVNPGMPISLETSRSPALPSIGPPRTERSGRSWPR